VDDILSKAEWSALKEVYDFHRIGQQRIVYIPLTHKDHAPLEAFQTLCALGLLSDESTTPDRLRQEAHQSNLLVRLLVSLILKRIPGACAMYKITPAGIDYYATHQFSYRIAAVFNAAKEKHS
jgi:hypothetical protein